MGHLQGLGQDSSLRWKAVPDQDEDSHPSSALHTTSRPHASKPAKSGLPVKRQSVCPPSNLPSTARSDSMPPHERAASDLSPLLEDRNPFCHIRSSIGRLSLQHNGGMSRRMPLRVIRESTAGNHAEGGNAPLESEKNGTTSSDSLLETRPPISIRSHIAAQLKGPDQDRNGMRIRRSHELGPPGNLIAKDRRTTARSDFDHYLPTIAMEMKDNGPFPQHENMTSYIRQRKQRPVFGGPPKFPVHDSHGTYPSGQDSHVFPPVSRQNHQQGALGSFNGHYSSLISAKNHHASIGDKGILPVVSEAKCKDPYVSMKGGSLPKFIPAQPNRVDDVMTSSFGKGVLTTSGNGNTPLQQTASERAPTHKDAYMPRRRPMGWVGRFNPDLDPAFAPRVIRMPAVPLDVLSPPPHMVRPRPPPMEELSNFTDVKGAELPRASNRSRNDSSYRPGNQGHVRVVQSRPKPQCWEHGCNGRQFSTFSNLLRHQREKSGQVAKVSCPDCGEEFTRTTARNEHLLHQKCKHKRQPLTDSNAIDGTKGISSTISKDSSADECVRQARLLADMGERSQKTHNENDKESTSAEPRPYTPEFWPTSDDDDLPQLRGLRTENLEASHDAITKFSQHREGSPSKTEDVVEHADEDGNIVKGSGKYINPYMEDVDEDGNIIKDSRKYFKPYIHAGC